MSDEERFHSRLPEPNDEEVFEYRAVSGLAVAGLLLGLLAATALLTPALWLVALAGLIVNGMALARIARDAPALIGRKAALAGLILSVFFSAAAAADWATYRYLVHREARQFAVLWFDYLRNNAPHKAHQLTLHPSQRNSPENLWEAYFNGSVAREELEMYLDRPEVRALLALGNQAQVRYYASAAQSQEGGSDYVDLVYAVTFREAGQKKTFLLDMTLQRHRLSSPPRAEWQVVDTKGGVGPDGKEVERKG